MRPRELSIREYFSGDESGILKLFEEVFGKRRTVAEWNWQYNDNSHGKGWIAVGAMNHRIVGHSAITRADLNFKGQRVACGQAGDAMTHSSIRRNKLFSEIRECCYKLATDDGLQAVFCFPNRLAYPGGIRNSGWYKIVRLSHFFRRIGLRKLWGRQLDGVFKFLYSCCVRVTSMTRTLRYKKNMEIIVSPSLPDDLEEMLRDIRTYDVLAVWKDVNYLKWRYENNPRGGYLFHVVRTADRPRALMVSRDCGDTIAICDLLHRENDEVSSLLLIDHAVKRYIRSPAQKIEFYGHDAGYFGFVFGACGFRSIPFSPLVFTGRVFSNPDLERLFILPNNWTIAYGDTDVI